ncbi:MAG: hypothetical protein ACR5LD_08940 [Symbiopectobacterium sp.]
MDKDMIAVQALLRRLAVLSKIYTLKAPFTGLIKETIRLTGFFNLSRRCPLPRRRPAWK